MDHTSCVSILISSPKSHPFPDITSVLEDERACTELKNYVSSLDLKSLSCCYSLPSTEDITNALLVDIEFMKSGIRCELVQKAILELLCKYYPEEMQFSANGKLYLSHPTRDQTFGLLKEIIESVNREVSRRLENLFLRFQDSSFMHFGCFEG
jgi:hypothetical protein